MFTPKGAKNKNAPRNDRHAHGDHSQAQIKHDHQKQENQSKTEQTVANQQAQSLFENIGLVIPISTDVPWGA